MTISVEQRLKGIEDRLGILERIVKAEKGSSGEVTTASIREGRYHIQTKG